MSAIIVEGDTVVIAIDKPSAIISESLQNNIAVSSSSSEAVTSERNESVIVSSESISTVASSGSQGPQGIPGDSINYVNLLAGQVLAGHRIVYTNDLGRAVYADKDIPISADRLVGITTGATNDGLSTEIQIVGILEEPSWSWDITKLIYVGSNGMLTQDVPTTGYLYTIAFPVSATKLFINKQPPIMIG